jgi:hypothetical protein
MFLLKYNSTSNEMLISSVGVVRGIKLLMALALVCVALALVCG